MSDNLKIWDALAKTDPRHTKPFKRGGGFSGTAIKPIWIVKMLTEQFGPVGTGWGMNQPSFQVVPGADGEILVYCTVECWHTAPDNTFYGVGGDKVVSKNKNGLFHDDEAFKKAFTDAVNNAFKFLGVGADVHMGLFDDDKYVSQAREEFAEPEPVDASLQLALDGVAACETTMALKTWWDRNGGAIVDRHVQTVVDAIDERKKAIALMDRVAA